MDGVHSQSRAHAVIAFWGLLITALEEVCKLVRTLVLNVVNTYYASRYLWDNYRRVQVRISECAGRRICSFTQIFAPFSVLLIRTNCWNSYIFFRISREGIGLQNH
ncbi:hypothetical protein B0T26DRAFT_173665 [Lasiosphaeria miniovina]|uniref:Secreted protein n=1 Tax=Lasiosphaeria miniovina TaxID=1954250 RepID=A0AA40B6A5_9PEZI|nr:uncharacterized protein B0T26DRAFT_173665 [Lasiosphaeria miniovina]KAK0728485.1 hypothetical protein B0T26DRAFT_173665 [Lasiosphaeria miniovina]